MATKDDIESWLAKTAIGDRDAFMSLYRATSAKLFGVVLRVLNDRAEAEEVLQEVYLRVWDKAGLYNANGLSPMTWLITVARNKAIDRLRTRKGDGQVELPELVADDAPGPEAQAIAGSESRALQECLDELEPKKAMAVKAVYLHGASYKDLSAALDVPLNTIRTWLRRSLISLKECLSR